MTCQNTTTRLTGLLLALALASCAQTGHHHETMKDIDRDAEERRIAAVLDDFHLAASEADEERYFGHLTEEAVFLGTDASERWTKQQFREYVHPYFSQGRGWTYESKQRWIGIDDGGSCAWFDERLHNAKYGATRGSGALVRHDGAWRIVLYDLTIPIPNDLAGEVVERIKALQETPQ